MYTTSTAFLEALQEAGVSYIFGNFGTDHPAIFESLAMARKENKKLPEVIVCPHEMIALSAAHGYAQTTGEPQAVIVHVDVGTQNLGAAVHNAAKGKVPVLIFAGTSPFTLEGELTGSRNENIHGIQDVFDQRGIVRQYVKYDNEIRTGQNVKQLVHRAMQFANSEPKGPVYLIGAREVLEEEAKDVNLDLNMWGPISPSAIAPDELFNLVDDLINAKNPLIVTSYLGRNTEAVGELVRLSERLAIPVIEQAPNYMNFPSDHPMHCGIKWGEKQQNEQLAKADVVLVLDSDIPWIQMVNKPTEGAAVYYIDVDPLKENTPLWYIPSKRFFKADSYVALKQINHNLDKIDTVDNEMVTKRWDEVKKIHDQEKEKERAAEQRDTEVISPEYLTACVREIIDDKTIVLSEGITNYRVIAQHIGELSPGSYFAHGASGLGWNGGASIGAKLANPNHTIINLIGDGSYLFSVPSSVHWMSHRYKVPFLTVIYNNRGWKSPKMATLNVHPDGISKQTNDFSGVDFGISADLAKIAEAAGGAYACTVENTEDLKSALQNGLKEVKSGRSAVIDVRLRSIDDE